MYAAISPDDYTNDDIGIVIYAFGLVGCGVFESVSLLIAVRNIIAVNLLKPENLKDYVVRSNGILYSLNRTIYRYIPPNISLNYFVFT